MSNANLSGISSQVLDELVLPNVPNSILQTDSTGYVTGVTDVNGLLHSDTTSYYFAKISANDIDLNMDTLRCVISDANGDLDTSSTTSTEISYLGGATSNIQTQINTKASTTYVDAADALAVHLAGTETITGSKTFSINPTLSGETASRAAYFDASKVLQSSSTTSTELGYVNGVTSAIQTQLNTKATDSLVVHLAGAETITGSKTFTNQAVFTSGIRTDGGTNSSFDDLDGVEYNYGTASRALYLDASKIIQTGSTTSTELSYLNGVTSAVQTQLNSCVHKTGTETVDGAKTFTNNPTTFNNISFSNTAGEISSSSLGSSYIKFFVAPVGGGTPVQMCKLGQTEMEIYSGYNLRLSNLTLSKAIYLDSSNRIASSATTPTELGYVSGVTSAIQTQLNSCVHLAGTETITGTKTFSINPTFNGETASRAAYFDASKILQSSATTSTELGYVNGVTSAIQTQLNSKAATNYVDAQVATLNESIATKASTTYVDAANALAVHLAGSETITGSKTFSATDVTFQKDSSNLYLIADNTNKRIKLYNSYTSARSLSNAPSYYYMPMRFIAYGQIWNTIGVMSPSDSSYVANYFPIAYDYNIMGCEYLTETTGQTPTAFEFKIEEKTWNGTTTLSTSYFQFTSPTKIDGANVWAGMTKVLYASDKSTIITNVLNNGYFAVISGRANGVNSADKFKCMVTIYLGMTSDWN